MFAIVLGIAIVGTIAITAVGLLAMSVTAIFLGIKDLLSPDED